MTLDMFAIAEQGRRSEMEDRHVLALQDDTLVGAVFDGHGGAQVADYAAARLPELPNVPPGPALVAIHGGTLRLKGGACAVAFRLHGEHLQVANVGDTGLALVEGEKGALVTAAHRLDRPEERARVLAAGAVISGPYVIDPRTGDGLMPTRTIGDHQFADLGIICEPEEWTGRFVSGWLVAASDALWDVMAPEELPGYLTGSAKLAAHALAREVLEGRSGADNLTIIVVRATPDELTAPSLTLTQTGHGYEDA